MNKSESIAELSKSLSKFQGNISAVKKDASNPFFKSKYATLDTIWESIRKPLSDNGLSVIQSLDYIDGKSMLETTLLHTSGEWISGKQYVNPEKDSPQGLGSAITYARRYSLSAILGIVSDEDDDAESATKRDSKKPQSTEKPIKEEVSTTTQKIPDVDMDWLKKSLAMLKWNPVPWLNEHFNMEKETVTDCLLKMTKAQRVEFIQVVNDRLEKESPF